VSLFYYSLALGIVGYAYGMKNFVGGTKSLEGSSCVAWAIVTFNMEQLAHHCKAAKP
jgi:dolichol kinase